MSTPCEVDSKCLNGSILGDDRKCALCAWSPDNVSTGMLSHYWYPVRKGDKHPEKEKRKRANKLATRIAKQVKKRLRDKDKIKISRQARQAEHTSERNIIHATKNSGRVNRDGDHILNNYITLDTKLQSNRSNPVVLLGELDKVRRDSVRAGTLAGGLLLRNKHNVGVIVFREEDIAKVIRNDSNNEGCNSTITEGIPEDHGTMA